MVDLQTIVNGGLSENSLQKGIRMAEEHGASPEYRTFVEEGHPKSTDAHNLVRDLAQKDYPPLDEYPVWVQKLWEGDVEWAFARTNSTKADGATVENLLLELFPHKLEDESPSY